MIHRGQSRNVDTANKETVTKERSHLFSVILFSSHPKWNRRTFILHEITILEIGLSGWSGFD